MIAEFCETPWQVPSFASEANIDASWSNMKADVLQITSGFSSPIYQMLYYMKDYHSIGHYVTVSNESEIFIFEANEISILVTIANNQRKTKIFATFAHLLQCYFSKLLITVVNEACLWRYFIREHFRLTS